MDQTSLEILGACIFAIAVLHTFFAGAFKRLGNRYPQGSTAENFFHLLGEVEVTFGLWSMVLAGILVVKWGNLATIQYLETLQFNEPLFVFVIMTIAATRPVLTFARVIMHAFASALLMPKGVSLYLSCLILGPLLGSLITEPAAMTVTALLLKDLYFDREVSERFKYLTLGCLFVNISIGGVLTSFAAPPVLMVAHRWGWDTAYMFKNYGWEAIVAVCANAMLMAILLRKELLKISVSKEKKSNRQTPLWVVFLHLLMLGGVVFYAHHPVAFFGIFLFFLGAHAVMTEFHDSLRMREALLVAFFLAGLVVLGSFQSWWLRPLLASLDSFDLYIGTTLLTAVTDNAALTYLGSQVPDLSELSKHALVAGAVVGGGLTVIANAPNPAGYSILQKSFRSESISAVKLLFSALVPTLIAFFCLWYL